MTLRILVLALLLQGAHAATLEEAMTALRTANRGSIAFCKPSIVDELQIIGSPRQLSEEEARELGQLMGAEDTYFERQANGDLIGGHSLCLVHWDFKIFLNSKDANVAIRLCSGCRQIAITLNGQPVDGPDLRNPAMTVLAKHFDSWFPGWAKTTERNRMNWEKRKNLKRS